MSARSTDPGGARRAPRGRSDAASSTGGGGLGLWYDTVGLRTARTSSSSQRPTQSASAPAPARTPGRAAVHGAAGSVATAAALAYEPTLRPPARARVTTGAATPSPTRAREVRPRREPTAQPLHVVRRRSRVRLSTLGLLVVIAVMAAAALVGPMLLNVAGMRVEWRLAQLEERRDTLVSERASLSTQAAALGSTPRIMEQAQRLGMQPASRVNYVVLPGGDAALETASAGNDEGAAATRP